MILPYFRNKYPEPGSPGLNLSGTVNDNISMVAIRKTLVNGLAAGFPHLGKDRLAAILEDTGFSPQIRGERLSIEAFARIANAIYREH